MPIYVYACDGCGNQFEQSQSFKDDPLTVCVCGREGQVRRVFQPVGIVFKGSGWYVTDSRKSESAAVTDKGSTNGTDKSATDTSSPAATTTESTAPASPATNTASAPAAAPTTT